MTMNTRWALVAILMSLVGIPANADGLDALQQALESGRQVQEKVYVHTDNTCYFIGDTLWYKAYVLRADDFRPTDMSRLLYVELLSPDGLVVERQRIVVSPKGYTCGQFVLQDSLYSGYYELRAYTRWMLNFNVSHRHYTRDDRHLFYNNQMAADFFREWDGLFSRVVPIYAKPHSPGQWDEKYMYGRPKQDVRRTPKDELRVSFFPEGGSRIDGMPQRVAFEVCDQYGRAVDLSGTLSDGTALRTDYMGRGTFELSGKAAGDPALRARFEWKGKNYTFSLPKMQEQGVVLRLDEAAAAGAPMQVALRASAAWQGQEAGLAVLCRGRLAHFQRFRLADACVLSLDPTSLPTGVNELLVFDAQGSPLASRLFFVNNHDAAVEARVSTGGRIDFAPYEPIPLTVDLSSAGGAAATSLPGGGVAGAVVDCFSVAVRDAHTDEPSFDDGNMLTELLLSSDLKGFVARPAYYFERDDARHRQHLDQLLMVQGWRRYRQVPVLRYEPERSFTIEGSVWKMLGIEGMQRDQIEGLNNRVSVFEEQQNLNEQNSGLETGSTFTETGGNTQIGTGTPQTDASTDNATTSADNTAASTDVADGFSDAEPSYLGVNHSGLKHEVLVEAELNANGQTVGAVQLTHDRGHFVFELPAYYGSAILFMKAYERKDSLKKSMTAGLDKGRLDEDAYADFYVKRDLFYPVFARKYSWYENHLPEWGDSAGSRTPFDDADADDAAADAALQPASKLDGDHTLSQVDVRARRRGRRAVDYSKPAFVVDAYDLYNLATDRGLSWGLVNMGSFPPTAAFTVYGNMGRYKTYNVRARLADGPQLQRPYTFYQNYQADEASIKNRSEGAIFNDLHLYRLGNFRFYTDYEPRDIDTLYTESVNREDITLVYETLPDNAKRYTYRDRRYVLPGFAEPAEFYQPDYSQAVPPVPTDYRRTLYWNPNARLDAEGRFSTTLYNNSRETRVRVSVAGVTTDGRIVGSR